MKWFKHDTDASTDAKIKKLIIRHGAVGYAIYFHCLELIAGDVTTNKITFELEHDAEIIADNLKITGSADQAGMDIVNTIMKTILDLRLFESSNNKIYCMQLAKRIDSSMTSNPKFRSLIKESHDRVMIQSCKKIEDRRDKKIEDRIDKTNIEPKKEIKNKYGEYKNVRLTKAEYNKLIEDWTEAEVIRMIKELDEGIELKGYKYKSHNLALRKWKSNETTSKPTSLVNKNYIPI